jgi:hypothetical protein
MLVKKLRSLSFRAILRQDSTYFFFNWTGLQMLTFYEVGWFDEEENSTGALTSGLSDAPQKACLDNCAALIKRTKLVSFALG